MYTIGASDINLYQTVPSYIYLVTVFVVIVADPIAKVPELKAIVILPAEVLAIVYSLPT